MTATTRTLPVEATRSVEPRWCAAFRALAARCRQWANELREEGCIQAAHARERFACEIDRELQVLVDEELRVPAAALESGYSKEHIRRVLRERPELNCGRKGSPRIRRGDLPTKRGLARRSEAAYDAVADARSLSRQGG